jgi:NAD-dependent dihydropyrimidine dehydrogenase PreA subunit
MAVVFFQDFRRYIMAYKITVDLDKCVGDGECVDVCPVEVYELQDGKAVAVNEEECLGCESCVEVCEQDAITVEEA